jgi:hypothetical protein
MAARGSKPFFSFLTFAFLMASLAAGLQALIQWQHPADFGWADQLASARSGNWGTWFAIGLPSVMGLVCLLFGAFSFLQRRRVIGAAALLFSFALAAAPELSSPWTLYAAGGSFLLCLVSFMITGVLAKRASKPKSAAAKKAP